MQRPLDAQPTPPDLRRRGDLEPRLLMVTGDPRRRTISVLRSDDKIERYALHRYPDGTVAWRADTFSAPRDPTQPERWVAYHGELSVSEVIARVREKARAVREWTREEIGYGAVIEDPAAQERRTRSLERLRAELDAAA